MPNPVLINKLAKLAVRVGANVQKDQVVVIRGTTETKELIREIAEEAYLAGAKSVHVQWSDDYVSKSGLKHQSLEELENIPSWLIDQNKDYVEKGACFISVTSPIPGLNKDVDPMKAQKQGIAAQKALGFFREHLMGNKVQWTIVAAPNTIWAKQVFPKLGDEEAVEALWNAIFEASRVTLSNDPIQEWAKHNEILLEHNEVLNKYNFKHLHFKNKLGTDLIVELVKDHVWAGGGEIALNKAYFNPNIPTEETFTMPYKWGTRGKVVATKPLNYQGKLIEDFYLIFKDGKVVEFDAKKEKNALQNLLDTDENSRYIGEIALISHDSPISNTGILFLNTLFDENASCHMALGRAYPMNVKNGVNTPIAELEKIGYNNSMVHSDFMFGSEDMEIVGLTQDGKEVQVFKKGNFII
ncbi:MAG: peptidase M29 [Tenericutes bacterium GWC2_34_14]|nr:MAG: peptidase M29 [Tenericutes bacterium GWC2_34_14]OHE34332.1 MAG: peptidase M29 [Tenericutes bacterium GWE2_34_108]OHE35684.1 MAG: peptidase M29 [Tenericutes bacterium GWF1_35_14]OHE38899.1 MAG: peptidase M29 [Tenericutes bacterium GWF2_35_184]OHE43931.1 MAG: peptidase M29 [Tenericutes bacterium RIFOXYA2_FULL_36_32]OHE45659.1 MAG: peptidase M29 [Tenericutes bacterium RIFOXYA12_FULL_35_10]OHE46370.1 MAG: peptidase M29 [Tenericutes bacterium RIFOXYB2_FULL_36_25]OHE48694.1 MAG: peptidase 